jgi:hypothetical protein
MARKNGTELAKVEEQSTALAVGVQAELPDYLSGSEKTGMEKFGREDLKIPRLKLLQPLSPEIKAFQGEAIPGEFWHTVANKSVGKEFLGIVCIAAKRVILWRPRDDGDGGMLAISRDAVNWQTGANQKFTVNLKGVKDPVTWETKGSVGESGLLEFGTQNPDDPKSAPAATLSYEYLLYLIDHPELSPVVLSAFKTGIPNAKGFNSFMFMQRKPIPCMVAKFFADEKKENRNDWFVPGYNPSGYATKELYQHCSQIAKEFEEYDIDLEQTEETDNSVRATASTTVEDGIKY